MGITRWIGASFRYKFITSADLRVGHIALNMRDGNHYCITDKRGRKITTGAHDKEISRSKFIKWTPWTYPEFTYSHDSWFPQMIKTGATYAWTSNAEDDDCITDGCGRCLVLRVDRNGLVLTSDYGIASIYHHCRAGAPMLMQKIPVVDED